MQKVKMISICTVAALAVAGCSNSENSSSSSSTPATSTQAAVELGQKLKETKKVSPRIVISHDGGIRTIDLDGKVLDDYTEAGFYRLSGAGDGRYVMVADGNQFRVYDTAISEKPHGDHSHAYEGKPGMTQQVFDADHAGHAVPHADKTALFADGTGEIQFFDTAALADGKADVTSVKLPNPHHGVALALEDGSFLSTLGNEKERTTVAQMKGNDVITKTEDCPSVHGESASSVGFAFGCTNGPVVFRDGEFHKVPVEDAYARSGNLAGSPKSPIVLGDYKTDKDAKLEHPTRVALIDTRNDSLKLVDVGSTYWFRSLGRGPAGEGLVLTADGNLQIIDVESGTVTKKIPVIQPWEEKEKWQEAGPNLQIAGNNAYVTDAENNKLVVVDLKKGEVTKELQLDVTPVEIAVTTGKA